MEKMYKVREVAEILGVAEITVRMWIYNGKIDSVKIMGSRRIPESVLLELQKGVKRV